MTEYFNYINGKWVKSLSKKTFVSLNPTNKKIIGKFQRSNKQDVEKAVRAAKDAFDSWKNTPAPRRADILLKAAQILKERKKEIGTLVSREMGKVLKEGLGDVQEAIDFFEYIAGEGRRLFGRTTPSELPDKFAMTFHIPIGVCGIIPPWNFPIAIPAWKIAPALVCGNTVVFKPASDTPLCAVRFVEVLEKAGLPKGVLNLVTGSGTEVGVPLVEHPDVKMISFTGSLKTGKFIASTCAALMKRTGLELGGKNAIIVMDDANLDSALEGVIWGAFGTAGQRCTATSRVIVHEKIYSKFEKMLLKRTKALRLGDPLDKSIDVGPIVNEKQLERINGYVILGKMKDKAKLLIGGCKYTPRAYDGFFYKPTIFSNVTKEMTIAKEEIFGPVLCLMKAKDLDDAIEICNSIEYGLSSAIYTTNITSAFKAIEKINTGLTYVNSSTIGSEVHLPFGGTKHTGNGTREAGWSCLNEFSEEKTIYIDYSGKLQKAQGID